MKGSVKIYGTASSGEKHLLVQQDNLTTVGFSEQITNLLTTPSSIKFPTSTNTACLDSSNYEIQAISMSKNKEHFKKNAHSYTTTNILHNSNLKDTSKYVLTDISISANMVLGFSSEVSGSLLTAYTSGGVLSQRIKYNNAAGEFSAGFFSGTQMTASIDVKFNRDNPPVQVSSGATGGYMGQSAFSLFHGNRTARTLIMWDSSGRASLEDDNSSASWTGGIRDLDGGWYRVFLTTDAATTADFSMFSIFPSIGMDPEAAYGSTAQVDGSAGSLYIARPQLELGKVPTNYVETSSYQNPRDNTLAFSLLNGTEPYGIYVPTGAQEYNYYIASGSGGLSISAIYGEQTSNKGTSAYIPYTSSVTPSPHPNDRELTTGARTSVEEALGIEFTKGQNVNTLDLGNTLQLSSYNTNWSYTDEYTSEIGRHVAYMGSFGVKTPEYLTNLIFVSALDFNGYNNFTNYTLHYNGIGSYRTDRFGYIELSPPLTVAPLPGGADDFVKIANPDFSSTGEITYQLHLRSNAGGNQRSLGWLNAFGGVDTLGLWGLDLVKMREDNINVIPPYSSPTGHVDSREDPERRYKLFNKLVLTDSIVTMQGKNLTQGVFGNYKDLDIYWKVKFL